MFMKEIMDKLNAETKLLLARFDPRQMSMFGADHEAELQKWRPFRLMGTPKILQNKSIPKSGE
jgi:hypothetical protein